MKSRLISSARPARILTRGIASLVVASALAHFFPAFSARATTLFWSGNGSTRGGAGTWNT